MQQIHQLVENNILVVEDLEVQLPEQRHQIVTVSICSVPFRFFVLEIDYVDQKQDAPVFRFHGIISDFRVLLELVRLFHFHSQLRVCLFAIWLEHHVLWDDFYTVLDVDSILRYSRSHFGRKAKGRTSRVVPLAQVRVRGQQFVRFWKIVSTNLLKSAKGKRTPFCDFDEQIPMLRVLVGVVFLQEEYTVKDRPICKLQNSIYIR